MVLDQSNYWIGKECLMIDVDGAIFFYEKEK